MYIILSQKITADSEYADLPYRSYHFPARYRNQIRTGDIFIYYQGNRHDKSQRYYFGVGTVGNIRTIDGVNYYAELTDCEAFDNVVPIHYPDGGYIEQLGYQEVRKSENPPWQSSIRRVSEEAFYCILQFSGGTHKPVIDAVNHSELDKALQQAIRQYYLEPNKNALFSIENIAHLIVDKEAAAFQGGEQSIISRYLPEVQSNSAACEQAEMNDKGLGHE